MPLRVVRETGTARWALTAPAGSLSSPIVGERRVYLRVGRRVAALDRDSGAVLWQVTPRAGSATMPRPALTAAGGFLLALSVNGNHRAPARLAVLEGESGTTLHRHRFLEFTDLMSDGQTLVVAHFGPKPSGCHRISAYDLLTGKALWERPFFHTSYAYSGLLPVFGSVLVVQGVEREVPRYEVRPGYLAPFHGYDLRTGTRLWRRSVGVANLVVPRRAHGRGSALVFALESRSDRLHWLSPTTGETLGTVRLRWGYQGCFLEIADFGETVWLGHRSGSRVRRMRPYAVTVRPDVYRLPRRLADREAAFAVADGWLYAQDNAGRLWTAHAGDGRTRRLRVEGDRVRGLVHQAVRKSLTMAGDRVYAELPHRQHGAALVGLRHGRILWQRAAGDIPPVQCGNDLLLLHRGTGGTPDRLLRVDGEAGTAPNPE
ncbi:PQQ-binding-like beta-propeller repeat protein [Streptomyces sp. NPDC001388]|uniref:outer membrane protein assembly factor BamB family protein n=1 Tax=Streptomyces sp. NPDC001388 TaxID=3364568 RepID=UPI003686A331